MNKHAERNANRKSRLLLQRKLSRVYILLIAFLVLGPCGNAFGFSAEVGDSCMALSAGGSHTCILDAEGEVYCYGDNSFGQRVEYYDGDAIGLSAGYYHTCILKADGNVDCYGYNANGQTIEYSGGDAVGVSAGALHTCILKTNGNVECFGNNTYGQSTEYTGGDAIGVSTGFYHTCILKKDGNVKCQGHLAYGQANDWNGGNAVGVSAGAYHTCVLKADGNVDCYGNDSYGQVAGGYTGGDAIGVSAGFYHTCILKADGNVFCYGDDLYGQLMDYNEGDAIGVSANFFHTCILQKDGYVYCSGWNEYGQAENYTVGNAVCTKSSENQPPVFDPIEPIDVTEYDLVELSLTVSDPDGDGFELFCPNPPPGASFDAINGTLTWIPIYDQAGTYIVTFLAADDGVPSETGQLDVTITVNDISPEALNDEIIDTIINDMDLPLEVVNSYIANLKKVNVLIERGNIIPAINQLEAFINKVYNDIDKGLLDADEGQMLIDMANDIINTLSE